MEDEKQSKSDGTRGGPKSDLGPPRVPSDLLGRKFEFFEARKVTNSKEHCFEDVFAWVFMASWGHLAFFEGVLGATFASPLHSGPRSRNIPRNLFHAFEEDLILLKMI